MTEKTPEGNEHTEQPPVDEFPTKDEIIKAYIQYSEESRYRDGLMHNSYYFVLISVVIFAGHIISLDLNGPIFRSPRFGFAVFAGGVAAFGIGIIMNAYNRKRINAEDQRQLLENMLDEWFTKTGLHKKYGNEDFAPRMEDNPFAIQSTVIGRSQGQMEHFFINILPIKWIAILAVILGAGATVAGFLIMIQSPVLT